MKGNSCSGAGECPMASKCGGCCHSPHKI
jgi:hypothetical protein